MKRIKQTTAVAAVAGIAFFAVVALGSETLVELALGHSFRQSVPVFMLLGALPAGFWVTMVLGNLYLLAFGKYKTWSNLFIAISFAGLLLTLLFVAMLEQGAEGLAYALIIRVYSGLVAIGIVSYSTYKMDRIAPLKPAPFEVLP